MTHPIKAMMVAKPLIGFSHTSQLHLDALNRSAASITTELDRSLIPSPGEGKPAKVLDLEQARGDFWLWVLGAYELIRMLHNDHAACFAPEANARFGALLERLHRIRIPFAKLEFSSRPGQRNHHIDQEAFAIDIDFGARDYTYTIQGERFTMRELIAEFQTCLASLQASEVLHPRPGDSIAPVLRHIADNAPPQDLGGIASTFALRARPWTSATVGITSLKVSLPELPLRTARRTRNVAP